MREVKQASVLEQAKAELAAEDSKRAVIALKVQLALLKKARQVVSNLEWEITDLEKQIEAGTF